MRSWNGTVDTTPSGGDADLTVVAGALSERARARMVLAVTDGRALPASVLADEAGVSAATASAHLRTLVDAGVLVGERHGRFRYFRLAGPEVADLVEALGRVSPRLPVRSLREGTRAHALRAGRTCYDHLAGRLGVALTDALIHAGYLRGGDGSPSGETRGDRLPGTDPTVYLVTAEGGAALAELGVRLGDGLGPVSCCVDWTEQRHHVAGALGRRLLTALRERDWVRPAAGSRAVSVTDAGREALEHHLGVTWPLPHGPLRLTPT